MCQHPNFIQMPNGDLVIDPGGPQPTDTEIPLGYKRVPGKPYRFQPEDEFVLAELRNHKPGGCKGCHGL